MERQRIRFCELCLERESDRWLAWGCWQCMEVRSARYCKGCFHGATSLGRVFANGVTCTNCGMTMHDWIGEDDLGWRYGPGWS